MIKQQLAAALAVAIFAAAVPLDAQGVRSRTRLAPRGGKITRAQAEELTLTVTPVQTRQIQSWVRTAGALGPNSKVVTVVLSGEEAGLVQVDQRARAFPVESRRSMYQARVIRVVRDGEETRADVELLAAGQTTQTNYVVEIVCERGGFLSVPNEAVIEEGDRQVVYLERGEGEFEPQTIKTGIQGELYTQIVEGVKEGDQVVTFGSFFIDSDYKLKGAAQVQK